ncbi:MAG: hypothetical protein H8D23_07780 [Candidatus Brocadiales bacterium]|nr:hypothetical protein [Candidatus Brocadiales bacterium]
MKQKNVLRNNHPGTDFSYNNKDGVDATLIRWMLSMTYLERLQTLQQNVESILKLRNAKTHT